MADPYNLQRFEDAQTRVYEQVCAELRRGRKTSHWIWFIFPQIAGLGHSPMAARYGIASLDEARAYLEHPVLNERLRECCKLLLAVRAKSIEEIMGYPDDLKLKSSMTLFESASRSSATGQLGDDLFTDVLETLYAGEHDELTVALLQKQLVS